MYQLSFPIVIGVRCDPALVLEGFRSSRRCASVVVLCISVVRRVVLSSPLCCVCTWFIGCTGSIYVHTQRLLHNLSRPGHNACVCAFNWTPCFKIRRGAILGTSAFALRRAQEATCTHIEPAPDNEKRFILKSS